MVLQLRLRRRYRLQALVAIAYVAWSTFAGATEASSYLADAQKLYQQGYYFKSARYAFAALEEGDSNKAPAYSWVALSLARAGLYQSSSYFFIKTLQSGDTASTRRVLTITQELMVRLGGDVFRNYLIRHTRYEDYDSLNRSAYLYSLGKEALLTRQEEKAIGYLSAITAQSPLWAFALQLRGSAHAILGHGDRAIQDFLECEEQAKNLIGATGEDSFHRKQAEREAEDLAARCSAGHARTLYQMDDFDSADRAYDDIPKSSLVWPDILFEQAWNSFGRNQYNRTLGKLVSYKSPALSFVYNPEGDVLRAQTYLALCLYSDANDVINDFNQRYSGVGTQVKNFVETQGSNLVTYYEAGKNALRASLYTRDEFQRMLNRFVRGPYFQNLVASEKEIASERAAIKYFSNQQTGAGFPGFLEQVLGWRLKAVRSLGGAFVKNSLMDYHAYLINDFEKMSFIKLEMLRLAKEKLTYKNSQSSGDRSRGSIDPKRRDDQYSWSFNGEFWNDELGDYVFGLQSECRSNDGGS